MYSITRIQGSIIPENGDLIYATPFRITPGTSEEAQTQPAAVDVLRVCNSISFTGLNLVHQSMMNIAAFNELQKDTVTRTTKRPREVARQHAFIRLPDLREQQRNVGFASVVPQSAAATVSSGLRPPPDDVQVNLASSKSKASSILMLEELQSEILKDKKEIDEFVNLQVEQMKCALQEKSLRHSRYLAEVEEELLRRLREKEAELEKVNRRNLELEERVKELTLESQLWEKVARDQEMMVSNLRACLEQAIQPEDAESCHYGEVRNTNVLSNNEKTVPNTCKACETMPVSVLLLPCRHLCLCKDCDKRIEWCPICAAAKIASLQVYMS